MEIERRLVLEVVRVTEQAALAASRLAGKGDKEAVDEAGTQAMRRVLNELPIKGTVVIGEGEMDEAPMLYIGEVLGQGGVEVDIAVDPVEGTTTAAKGLPNAVTVIAISEKGGLFHAPDMYMEKLIVPPPAAGLVDLSWPVSANLKALALALQRSVEDLVVVVLDRPRHERLIREIREAGARVKLISDGDVIAALAAAIRGTGVHAVMGIGGAPEGVLAAAALKCLGGEIQARFTPPKRGGTSPAQGHGRGRKPHLPHRGPGPGKGNCLRRHRHHRRGYPPGGALLRGRGQDPFHRSGPRHPHRSVHRLHSSF